ncbi:MAG: hypothetical protein ACM359_13610 [Bacillota bacterium]
MKIEMPEYFRELLADHEPPCVSLYMPTLRAKPPAAENSRRLGNLIRRANEEVNGRYPHEQTMKIRRRLEDLLRGNEDLWRHPMDGLAIWMSPDFSHIQKLQRPVKELVEVADTFYIKPLIRMQQYTGRFQVLCFSQKQVSIYEGNQESLERLGQRDVPRSIDEALGRQSRGVPAEVQVKSISGAMDGDRFVQIIDRAVWEKYSRPSGLPLMLCAVDRWHGMFRRLSHNPYLMAEGIRVDPESMTPERLREEAWKVMEPYYRQRIEKVLDEYARARAHQQGSEDIAQVAQAAALSRIGTLLVDADKQVGGKIDPESGQVKFGQLGLPDYEDVLEEIAEKVIKTGGQVLVMPPQQMPTTTGVAAIYRF